MSFGIFSCYLSRAYTAMEKANNTHLYVVHIQPLRRVLPVPLRHSCYLRAHTAAQLQLLHRGLFLLPFYLRGWNMRVDTRSKGRPGPSKVLPAAPLYINKNKVSPTAGVRYRRHWGRMRWHSQYWGYMWWHSRY